MWDLVKGDSIRYFENEHVGDISLGVVVGIGFKGVKNELHGGVDLKNGLMVSLMGFYE